MNIYEKNRRRHSNSREAESFYNEVMFKKFINTFAVESVRDNHISKSQKDILKNENLNNSKLSLTNEITEFKLQVGDLLDSELPLKKSISHQISRSKYKIDPIKISIALKYHKTNRINSF